MNVFLDTEFNGFGGDLISLALVADNGREFHEVLPCPNPTPWVAKHVIPNVNKLLSPVSRYMGPSRARLQVDLGTYLKHFEGGFNIVADWPEDVIHFLQVLSLGPGRTMPVGNFTTELVFSLPPASMMSKVPHNTLEDARAVRACYYEAYPERKP